MAGAGADGDMIDIFLHQAGPPTSGGGTTRPSEQRTGVVSQPSAAKARVIRAASPTPSELSALRAAGIAADDAGAAGPSRPLQPRGRVRRPSKAPPRAVEAAETDVPLAERRRESGGVAAVPAAAPPGPAKGAARSRLQVQPV